MSRYLTGSIILKSKREDQRKAVGQVYFKDLSDLETSMIIAHHGRIIDASSGGFLVQFHRDDADQSLRTTLNLDHLIGIKVVLFLPQMEIDIDGKITRTQHIGKGNFEMGVSFSESCSEYWRECLKDLLPYPGEFD